MDFIKENKVLVTIVSILVVGAIVTAVIYFSKKKEV